MNSKKTTKIISFLLCLVLLVGIMPTTAFAAKENFTTISTAAVNVYSPIANNTVFDYVEIASGESYVSTDIFWTELESLSDEGRVMGDDEQYKPGYYYKVTVELEGTGTYHFLSTVTATINGHDATVSYLSSKNIQISYVFPTMVTATVSNIDINVANPVAGKTPNFSKIEGRGFESDNAGNSANAFHNGISWYNETTESFLRYGTNAEFKAGNEYTLSIVLVAKTGYKFTTRPTVTINGSPATCDRISNTTIIIEKSFVLPEAQNGWVLEGEKWAYYVDGSKIVNEWMLDSVGWCYLGADGYMVTNSWIMDSVGWCYVGADGYCVTNCWMQDSVGWCYLDENGRMATNQWIMDSQGWCYVGADGYCITNSWMKDSIGWCYLDANGRMVYNTWVQDSYGWCYVGADGYMVYNCWIGNDYIGADGYWVA